jgi:cytochrome bd ubiquinol oxidase subunit I
MPPPCRVNACSGRDVSVCGLPDGTIWLVKMPTTAKQMPEAMAVAVRSEAGFIGIMLYGDGKVSQRTQLVANGLVALGTLLSTTWILAANSWMQTPAGFTRVDGQFQPKDWLTVIFNPSFPHRILHMLFAVLIAASWLIAGISAYYVARGMHATFSIRTFSIAMGVLAVLMPWQLFLGDNVASTMFIYQPAKMITVEGNYNSENSGYNLLVIPDPQAGKEIFQITVPNIDSLLGPHQLKGRPRRLASTRSRRTSGRTRTRCSGDSG